MWQHLQSDLNIPPAKWNKTVGFYSPFRYYIHLLVQLFGICVLLEAATVPSFHPFINPFDFRCRKKLWRKSFFIIPCSFYNAAKLLTVKQTLSMMLLPPCFTISRVVHRFKRIILTHLKDLFLLWPKRTMVLSSKYKRSAFSLTFQFK